MNAAARSHRAAAVCCFPGLAPCPWFGVPSDVSCRHRSWTHLNPLDELEHDHVRYIVHAGLITSLLTVTDAARVAKPARWGLGAGSHGERPVPHMAEPVMDFGRFPDYESRKASFRFVNNGNATLEVMYRPADAPPPSWTRPLRTRGGRHDRADLQAHRSKAVEEGHRVHERRLEAPPRDRDPGGRDPDAQGEPALALLRQGPSSGATSSR